MNLFELGFTEELASFIAGNNLSDFSAGRVTQEHRERYVVSDGDKEYDAEITGNMRFTAESRSDFPAVGDWVMISVSDSDQAINNNFSINRLERYLSICYSSGIEPVLVLSKIDLTSETEIRDAIGMPVQRLQT